MRNVFHIDDRFLIILLEAADELVANMAGPVRTYTRDKLRKMGVDVRLRAKVSKVTPDIVHISDQADIPTRTVVWTAGVRGEPIAGLSGISTGRDGRVPVQETLQVPGYPEIYVIGDLAAIKKDESVLPMVAQVAIQSGIIAAKNILRQIAGQTPQPFCYHDRGSMITIGRKSAGVAIG